MPGSEAEVERARATLRHLIDLSGLSRREVARRLLEERSGLDLGRLLCGRLDLKLRHALDISRVLGLHPLEFFRLVFKEPGERSPFLRQLEDLLASGPPAATSPPPTPADSTPQPDALRPGPADLARGLQHLAELRQGMAKLISAVGLLEEIRQRLPDLRADAERRKPFPDRSRPR
jgi:8-oxo-dGTP pyrophosphatase MutT (NUDIX family)